MAKVKALKLYIAIGILLAIFIPPFVRFQELCYKRRKLEDRIVALQAENKKLAGEKRKLETDIAYIERRVRDRIGVVRRGEIVLREEAPKRR